MNIDDARFLFSALIQMLPMVISVSLLILFANPILKEDRIIVLLGKKRNSIIIVVIIMVLLFYSSFVGDILVLMNLKLLIDTNSILPKAFIFLSGISLIYLILFVLWYLYQLYNPKEGTESS